MDEYIRRKVLIDAIDKTDWYHVNVQGRLTLGAANEDEALYKVTDIYNAIDKTPVADVVEVIRCRDCKYWKSSGSFGGKSLKGLQPLGQCEWVKRSLMANEYCSIGERGAQND